MKKFTNKQIKEIINQHLELSKSSLKLYPNNESYFRGKIGALENLINYINEGEKHNV